MNNDAKNLIKEIEEYNLETELNEFLVENFEDKIENLKMYYIVTENANRIPFDILLKLTQVLCVSALDVEIEYGAIGFNDWFKETYKKTVYESDFL